MGVILLNVPFIEKDIAKSLGAKWDSSNKKWYINDDRDIEPFREWIHVDDLIDIPVKFQNESSEMIQSEKGISLTEYLGSVAQVVAQNVTTKWIRAEVSRINFKGAHCYLELVDTSNNGKQLSKCHATIWQANNILNKFKEQTDSELKVGMNILLRGRADLHILYGLSISIEDIDPSYTIGNLIANLNALRERLQKEKIYDRNKLLPVSKDFTNVAVISPSNAAGLGDFRKEADLLAKYGLCKFTYYKSVFQGKEAGHGIATQIAQVIKDDQKEQYDALVIIRGGGSVTDLAWINDYDIAMAICYSNIPVFAGIGHERDNTIVDEVSCRKFDTPSKVIKYILTVITENASNAQTNINNIFERATFIIEKNKDALNSIFRTYIRELINKVASQKKYLAQTFRAVLQFSQHGVNLTQKHISFQFNNIITRSFGIITALDSRLGAIFHNNIIISSVYLIDNYKQKLSNNVMKILERGEQTAKTLRNKLPHIMQIVDLANPMNILQRGFTLVRSRSDKIVTSKTEALKSFHEDRELKLVFSDGNVVVIDIEDNTK